MVRNLRKRGITSPYGDGLPEQVSRFVLVGLLGGDTFSPRVRSGVESCNPFNCFLCFSTFFCSPFPIFWCGLYNVEGVYATVASESNVTMRRK